MNHVVLLGHLNQVGKDTAARMIRNLYGYNICSIAHTLKQETSMKYNIPINFFYFNKSDIWKGSLTYRDLLIREATENKGKYGPYYYISQTVLYPLTVIADFRFQSEYEYLLRENRVTTIRIDRDNCTGYSDLKDFPYKHVINNNGTEEELRNQLIGLNKCFSQDQ